MGAGRLPRYIQTGARHVLARRGIRALEQRPPPRPVAITGASNVTGWLPPIEAIIEGAPFWESRNDAVDAPHSHIRRDARISGTAGSHLSRAELGHLDPRVLARSLQAVRSKRKSAASPQR